MAPTVLIVSAGMGAGHGAVAAELARRLETAGAEPQVVDLLQLAGAPGRRLRGTYQLLLGHAPAVYGAAMAFWARHPAPMERLTTLGAGPFERALAQAVEERRPDVVVSTYNLASQCLGRLIARGAIAVPVVTVVTDAGPHPYWISPHVGRHLVPSPATARAFARYGAWGIAVTAPLVAPRFFAPPDRPAARNRLGLPAEARVVLVAGGSWAAGKLPATLAELATLDATVVVLCGHDEQLRSQLPHRPNVRAVGWTDDVLDHLAAADVLVDNAGGQTCWEAMAAGTPVVLHRPLPGHGLANARTLDALGWATFARTPAQLRAAVQSPRIPAGGPFDAADAAHEVLASADSGGSRVPR